MHKLKVLLADDHDSFRRILIAFLRAQKDIEVVGEAIDGQEAIEQAERFHPDLILMDIHMPKQNGIEATKAIKNRWPGTKVFILSMDPSEFYRRNTQDFADGFIAKSSIKNALLSVLSSEQQLHMNTVPVAAYAA
ncbi:MAG: response regulator transcription factor [Bacteroidota bacterium]|jgi:DNA-binding NarL/FixJ family response regulator